MSGVWRFDALISSKMLVADRLPLGQAVAMAGGPVL